MWQGYEETVWIRVVGRTDFGDVLNTSMGTIAHFLFYGNGVIPVEAGWFNSGTPGHLQWIEKFHGL